MFFRYLLLIGAVLPAISLFAQEGNKEVIRQEMDGHIFRPAQKEATQDRINTLKLPSGFVISKFAEGLGKPRMMTVTPEGFVYVTNREAGTVTLLTDKNKDGKSDEQKVVARKDQMHGIDYRNGVLYLITVNEVYTATVNKDGTLSALKEIVKGLPDGGQHGNRTLKFGPDNFLYISCGSTCNTCNETSPLSATMLQAKADGSNLHIYAKGLRNTIGFDWSPQTGELWGFDHGIDWLGDNDQQEELNKITNQGDYGWPYVYADGKFEMHADPAGMTHEEYAAKCTAPALLYTAHAAPMAMLFYTGRQFPEQYRNDAFVTMHGSWNRKDASGYKIVRVRFENGRPTGFEDFVTGFLTDGGQSQFARICGLVQYTDGSLLASDDANGVVYRISYKK